MKTKKRLLLAATVFLVLILGTISFTAACGPKEASQKSLKIGIDTSLSGPGAYWGQLYVRAMEMWANEENAEGGILVAGTRYPIELISEDDKFTPEGALSGAQKLIHQDKVKFVVGPIFGLTYNAMVPLATQEKVITMGNHPDPSQVLGTQNPYTFTTATPPHEFVVGMLKWFKETKQVKSVYFLHPDTADRILGMETTKAISADLGLKFTAAAYASGTTDFYPVVTKVAAEKPDLVDLGICTPEEHALIAKALKGLGYTGLILDEASPNPADVVAIGGKEAAEGTYILAMTGGPEDSWTAAKKTYYDTYVAKYGKWEAIAGGFMYGPFMLGLGIEKAGTISDTGKIATALETVEAADPWESEPFTVKFQGAVTYGAKHALIVPTYMGRIHDGALEIVTRLDIVCP